MNKFLFYSSLSILCLLPIGSCSESHEPDEVLGVNSNPKAFVLSQGNYYSHIEGQLDAIDFKTSQIENKVFERANGRVLGTTPQCGLVYGSKIYIGMNDSKTIEIIDRETYKSIKQISLQSSQQGQSPRSMVATGGKVYISMYEGYVARLDTISESIDAAVKVGANPEIMCLHQGKLYVPNSEGMNYLTGEPYGTTASIVSLNPFKEEQVITVPINPYKFMSNNDGLYLHNKGNYVDIESGVYKYENGSFQLIGPATTVAIGEGILFIANNPYSEVNKLSYTIMNTTTGAKQEYDLSDAPAPCSVAIDSDWRRIILTTYQKPEGVFADYDSPATAIEYRYNGNLEPTLEHTYRVGTNPECIFFYD